MNEADSNFDKYSRLQNERHQLLLRGVEPNTDPVDDLEDQMGVLWDTLTSDEQKALNLEASSLNALRREGGEK